MLSIFDLLDAGTLDLAVAAYLTARISRGTSFLVGALPGGAGKTTVMCALLNFVPPEVELVAATPELIHQTRGGDPGPRRCFVCHEIGSGPYFAYLWGAELRRYCMLAQGGHMLAANLHADDLSPARDQICGNNGVPVEHFDHFNLLIFLRVEGDFRGVRRSIERVYDGNGGGRRQVIYEAGAQGPGEDCLADPDYLQACRGFLQRNFDAGVRTIEQARKQVLEFLAERERAPGSQAQAGGMDARPDRNR